MGLANAATYGGGEKSLIETLVRAEHGQSHSITPTGQKADLSRPHCALVYTV